MDLDIHNVESRQIQKLIFACRKSHLIQANILSMIHKPWGSEIGEISHGKYSQRFYDNLSHLFLNCFHPQFFLSDLLLTKGLSWSTAYLIAEKCDIPQSFTVSFIKSYILQNHVSTLTSTFRLLSKAIIIIEHRFEFLACNLVSVFILQPLAASLNSFVHF